MWHQRMTRRQLNIWQEKTRYEAVNTLSTDTNARQRNKDRTRRKPQDRSPFQKKQDWNQNLDQDIEQDETSKNKMKHATGKDNNKQHKAMQCKECQGNRKWEQDQDKRWPDETCSRTRQDKQDRTRKEMIITGKTTKWREITWHDKRQGKRLRD